MSIIDNYTDSSPYQQLPIQIQKIMYDNVRMKAALEKIVGVLDREAFEHLTDYKKMLLMEQYAKFGLGDINRE